LQLGMKLKSLNNQIFGGTFEMKLGLIRCLQTEAIGPATPDLKVICRRRN
jgi:hypothetical protein